MTRRKTREGLSGLTSLKCAPMRPAEKNARTEIHARNPIIGSKSFIILINIKPNSARPILTTAGNANTGSIALSRILRLRSQSS